MNEQEKSLISAYFDNELTSDEKKAARTLIANNSEAHDYFQSLKILDSDLKNYIQGALDSEKVRDAIDYVVEGNKKSVSSGFFGKLFLPTIFGAISLRNNRVGLALSFTLIFSVGFFSNQFFLPSSEGNVGLSLDNFSNQMLITKDVIKTRSSNSEDDFEENVKQLIEEMIAKNSLNGRLNFGAKSFIIFLENKFKGPGIEDYFCFEGVIKSGNEDKSLVFCQNSSFSSLLFFN